jgi:hypothetical protein
VAEEDEVVLVIVMAVVADSVIVMAVAADSVTAMVVVADSAAEEVGISGAEILVTEVPSTIDEAGGQVEVTEAEMTTSRRDFNGDVDRFLFRSSQIVHVH